MKTLILLLLLTTGNVTASPASFITKNFNSIIAPIIENYPKTLEVRRRSVRRTRRTTRRPSGQQRPYQQNNRGLFGGLFGGMLLGSMFGNMFGGGMGGGSLLFPLLIGLGIYMFIRARAHSKNSSRYNDHQSDNYIDDQSNDYQDDEVVETIEEIYEDDVLVETRRTFSDSSRTEITDHRKDKK